MIPATITKLTNLIYYQIFLINLVIIIINLVIYLQWAISQGSFKAVMSLVICLNLILKVKNEKKTIIIIILLFIYLKKKYRYTRVIQ